MAPMGVNDYWCPTCDWSWQEMRRPVGDGPEFERRLAERTRMRTEAIAEHRRAHEEATA